MKGFLACCALAAVLLAGVWADHHGPHDHDHHHDHSMMACHKLAPPNADFGFNLYKSLNAKAAPGSNIFFSPVGIAAALSLLSTGAQGDTHSQLFSALGYSSHQQTVINEAYEHLFHMLGHSAANQRLDVGNAIAVRTGFNPLLKFIQDVKQFYSGKVFSVDFNNGAEAAAQINEYIANKTENLITDQVKDLDPEMAMVLINYVYFNGNWEKPFDPTLTERLPFHVDENTEVQVDMMKRNGRYDMYRDNDNHTTVLMLPYEGNTSMMIVLPDEGKMSEVEGFISKEHMKHWHDSLSRSSVDLVMPKFIMSTESPLETPLKEMGVTDAFADNADFSAISAEARLKVSKVSHKAVLNVNEVGTEAAATTTIEVMPMSMPEMMTMDRPFLVFIIEDSTRSILFMGKISNPSA